MSEHAASVVTAISSGVADALSSWSSMASWVCVSAGQEESFDGSSPHFSANAQGVVAQPARGGGGVNSRMDDGDRAAQSATGTPRSPSSWVALVGSFSSAGGEENETVFFREIFRGATPRHFDPPSRTQSCWSADDVAATDSRAEAEGRGMGSPAPPPPPPPPLPPPTLRVSFLNAHSRRPCVVPPAVAAPAQSADAAAGRLFVSARGNCARDAALAPECAELMAGLTPARRLKLQRQLLGSL